MALDRAGKLRYITMMPEVLEDRDVQNFRGRLCTPTQSDKRVGGNRQSDACKKCKRKAVLAIPTIRHRPGYSCRTGTPTHGPATFTGSHPPSHRARGRRRQTLISRLHGLREMIAARERRNKIATCPATQPVGTCRLDGGVRQD